MTRRTRRIALTLLLRRRGAPARRSPAPGWPGRISARPTGCTRWPPASPMSTATASTTRRPRPSWCRSSSSAARPPRSASSPTRASRSAIAPARSPRWRRWAEAEGPGGVGRRRALGRAAGRDGAGVPRGGARAARARRAGEARAGRRARRVGRRPPRRGRPARAARRARAAPAGRPGCRGGLDPRRSRRPAGSRRRSRRSRARLFAPPSAGCCCAPTCPRTTGTRRGRSTCWTRRSTLRSPGHSSSSVPTRNVRWRRGRRCPTPGAARSTSASTPRLWCAWRRSSRARSAATWRPSSCARSSAVTRLASTAAASSCSRGCTPRSTRCPRRSAPGWLPLESSAGPAGRRPRRARAPRAARGRAAARLGRLRRRALPLGRSRRPHARVLDWRRRLPAHRNRLEAGARAARERLARGAHLRDRPRSRLGARSRAPGHAELPALRAALMARHVERGEGRAGARLAASRRVRPARGGRRGAQGGSPRDAAGRDADRPRDPPLAGAAGRTRPRRLAAGAGRALRPAAPGRRTGVAPGRGRSKPSR